MASLIPGYEYDVFISYRQNDNKYDGWVKTFVNNLTLELEATIKDKVSVYFDIDPSEGLLETHSVDRSLENKLKCLIFIPILSKTYCDKSAFAWQNEFCAFNKLAREDKFGRDIRLVKGNFASRILPVRIHELDAEDMTLVENELGSTLRSIDFIYKSPGVNRPLRADEDHPKDNLNNTYYRDQINKVANSVAEILFALKFNASGKTGSGQIIIEEPLYEREIAGSSKKVTEMPSFAGNKLWIIAFLILIVLTIVAKIIFPSGFNILNPKEKEVIDNRISVTVMPFRNLTNDSALDYLTIGVQDWVVTCLSFYPEDFTVRPFELVREVMRSENVSDFSSVTPYTGIAISRRLDANFLLIGKIFKIGEIIRLNAQLIDPESEEVIKSFQEEESGENIMYAIDSLSIKIRNHLLVSKLTSATSQSDPDKLYRSRFITSSPEAFRFHILAKEALFDLDYDLAFKLDSQALAVDSSFVGAMATFCLENINLGRYEEGIKWLLKAYDQRERLPLVQQLSLSYQRALFLETPEEQIKYLRQLQKLEENNPAYFLILGYLYIDLKKFNEAIPELTKAQEIFKQLGTEPKDLFYYHYLLLAYNKTGQLRKGKSILKDAEKYFLKTGQEPGSGDHYFKMALIYCDVRLPEKADDYFRKGISINPGNKGMISSYAYSLIDYNLDVKRGIALIDSLLQQDPANGIYLDIKGWGFYRQNKYSEAHELLEKAYSLIPSYEIKAHLDSAMAAITNQK